jgi:transposase
MNLAHLLRNAEWAIDCGDTRFSGQFKLWLLRALAIGRGPEALRDSTLPQYGTDLERRLDRLMAHAVPLGPEGERLHQRIGYCREHLVFRKVTNAFRSEWGAATYAAFRSVVSTAKAKGDSVLNAVRAALCREACATQG